jgi:RNA recognition motif-containing protein
MSTEQPQSNRLYVGNIPWSTTVEELQGLFTDAENIEIPTVRFLLSFFFCFYNFDSIALVWETKKNFSRADDSFFHRRRVSTRSLSEKPLFRETSENRSPKSAENKERDFARRERNAGGKVLRGHSYCKKESEMRCHLAVFRGRLLS